MGSRIKMVDYDCGMGTKQHMTRYLFLGSNSMVMGDGGKWQSTVITGHDII